MEERYKVGDILTVQVRVKEVVEVEDRVVYAVVPRDEEYTVTLRIPGEDVLNKVAD